MLVLTRKQQEKIRIGDGITITVLKTKGKTVRLGIDAPLDVPVVRGELIFNEDQPEHANRSPDGADESERPSNSAPTVRAHERHPNWAANSCAVLQRVTRQEVDKLRGPLRAMLDSRIGATD